MEVLFRSRTKNPPDPQMPEWLKIPNLVNFLLVFVGIFAATFLPYFADHSGTLVFSACLLLYFLFFLTSYSLLHEATHFKLNSSRSINDLLGRISGVPLLMPFSLVSSVHWNHHLRNRTDLESYECYSHPKSKWRVTLRWYAILIGVWYWSIPPGSLMIAFGPACLRKRIMSKESMMVNFDNRDVQSLALSAMRTEVLLSMSYLAFLLFVLKISGLTLFLFYFFGSIGWSTTQYIDHAYSPRDVMEGAFNLQAPRWYSWFNLYRELDLAHHLYPNASWIHLPEICRRVCPEKAQRPFFYQYFLQWRGPVLLQEPSPLPIQEVRCDYSLLS